MFLYVCGYQGCGNSEPIVGHFDLFSTPLSCSHHTLNYITTWDVEIASLAGRCPITSE